MRQNLSLSLYYHLLCLILGIRCIAFVRRYNTQCDVISIYPRELDRVNRVTDVNSRRVAYVRDEVLLNELYLMELGKRVAYFPDPHRLSYFNRRYYYFNTFWYDCYIAITMPLLHFVTQFECIEDCKLNRYTMTDFLIDKSKHIIVKQQFFCIFLYHWVKHFFAM